MTIRAKLALWYSGLLTLIIIIFSIAVIMVSRITILNTVDRWLANLAVSVTYQIEVDSNSNVDTDTNQAIIFHSDKILHPPGVSFQVWHIADINTGESHPPVSLYDSDMLDGESIPLHEGGLAATQAIYGNITYNNVSERIVVWPVNSDEGVLFAIVQVSTPIQFLSHSNDQLIFVILISALICIFVSILLGRWLSGHLLKPVKAITRAAAGIVDANDLSTRLEWYGPQDELGELIIVFNNMMERLERVFHVQQRFISDVSHELRTPLTAIMGNLELMDLYGIEKTSIDAIQREAHRMHRMVKDLLWLIRADYGEHEMKVYTIDLDELALSVYESMLSRYHDRRLSIVMKRVEPVEMFASAEFIRQLLQNLMHNAIRFTEDGGRISLSVYSQNGQAIIEVQDTGIGISQAKQEHIFDRFFQADTSRVHYDESYGAGLGLSIVRWIVDAHHGTIEVESAENKGALFRVRLPLKPILKPNQQALDDTHMPLLRVKRQRLSHPTKKDDDEPHR